MRWFSTERPEMYIFSYKLELFFVDLLLKLGLIYILAFHQKGQECTFRATKFHLFVELE